MCLVLSESLEKRDVTVWVDEIGLKAGVDFLGKIGEAIINAKVTIYTPLCESPDVLM